MSVALGQCAIRSSKKSKRRPRRFFQTAKHFFSCRNRQAPDRKQDAAGICELEFTKMVMGHVKLNRRDKESGAAFERTLFKDPANGELRKA